LTYQAIATTTTKKKHQVTKQIGITELTDSCHSVSGLKQNFRTL